MEREISRAFWLGSLSVLASGHYLAYTTFLRSHGAHQLWVPGLGLRTCCAPLPGDKILLLVSITGILTKRPSSLRVLEETTLALPSFLGGTDPSLCVPLQKVSRREVSSVFFPLCVITWGPCTLSIKLQETSKLTEPCFSHL